MRVSELTAGSSSSALPERSHGSRAVVHTLKEETATHRASLSALVRAGKERNAFQDALPHMSCFRSVRRQLSPPSRPHAKRVIDVKIGHMYNNN
jgi:hypothetical protein